jgi:trehalose 6-phosphate phosphatase
MEASHPASVSRQENAMTRNILQCLDEVERWLARSPRCLCCSDFDGTLANLTDHPADSFLPQQRRELLATLARQPGCRYAIISGRGLEDVRQRVGLPEVTYAGNHGLEIAGPALSYQEPDAIARQRSLLDLCRDLSVQLAAWSGVMVEYKGLSASVHYKQAAPHDWLFAAQVVQMAVLAYGELFWIAKGNYVYEIRPRVEWNKGSAVRWLLRQLDIPESAVLYIGDDRTDEDAFQNLPTALTIHVGGSDYTAARWHLPDTGAAEVFLVYLTHQMSQRGRADSFNSAPRGRKPL